MADQIVVGVAGVALFVVVGFVTATMMLITERRRRKGLERRLQPVTSLDEEVAKLRGILRDQNKGIEELRSSYRQKLDVYNRLAREVAVFDEKLSFAEMGVYEPHFDYTDSEQYKAKILEVRARQKAMVSAKTAVICRIAWQVDGSAQKGQTMTNRNIRLTLRAFNNECEAAIANTRWNNVNAMEKRIATAREQIDKLNESNKIEVTREYLQLKLEELYLTHEHREKLKAEREEKAESARLAREEQKLIRDLERAEKDEARYQRLLQRAQAEASKTVGPQLDAYSNQIAALERDLAEAHSKVLRAQAMAEKTRSGYVYIVSNVGSFGEDVVKIRLTRRLDPEDRVREIGDASVPFTFDVHAIIYSDDAPGLERSLHSQFETARVNGQNFRKEFFRARIGDVEAAVKRVAPEAAFFKDVEAQEYRETLAKRTAALIAMDKRSTEAFPAAI